MSLRIQRNLVSGLALAASLAAAGTTFAQAPAAPPAAQSVAPTAPPDTAAPAVPTGPVVPLAESLTGMAKAEYGAARILYDDGDFQGALQKLKSAYDLSKDARLLWNMAACEKNLRHYAEVSRLVDRYLAEGGALVTAEDRAEASALLDTVKGFVTDLTIDVNEAGASVSIDDQPVGMSPLPGLLHVDMGTHKIRITKPGFVEFALAQDFPGGQPSHVSAQLAVERHEGKLRVLADPKDVLQVDGKVVGTGMWEGTLGSGAHSVYASARGKRAYQTEVLVQDNDVTMVHIALQDEATQTVIIDRSGVPAWVWVTGGALVAGASVGAYFLLRPEGEKFQMQPNGTWGVVNL